MTPEVVIGIDPGAKPGMVECRRWERKDGRWPLWLPGEIVIVTSKRWTPSSEWKDPSDPVSVLDSRLERFLPEVGLVAIEQPTGHNPKGQGVNREVRATFFQAGAFRHVAERWAGQVAFMPAAEWRRMLFGRKCPKCKGKGHWGRRWKAADADGTDDTTLIFHGGHWYLRCPSCRGSCLSPPGSKGGWKTVKGKPAPSLDTQVADLILEAYGGEVAVGGKTCATCGGKGRRGRAITKPTPEWLGDGKWIQHNEKIYEMCFACRGEGETARGPLYELFARGKKTDAQHHIQALGVAIAAANREAS